MKSVVKAHRRKKMIEDYGHAPKSSPVLIAVVSAISILTLTLIMMVI